MISLLSLLTLVYPLYTTFVTLRSLHDAAGTNIASLTDTVPISTKLATKVAELMVFWILMTLWLSVLKMKVVSFIISIIPLSWIPILYIQLWLGHDIVPTTTLNCYTSGSSIIYHYYFDNNMRCWNLLNKEVWRLLGIVGLKLISLVEYTPIALLINLNDYRTMFKQGQDGESLYDVFSNWMTTGEDTTIGETIICGLLAPMGYKYKGSKIPQSTGMTCVNQLSSTAQQTHTQSKTPSPAGSFDDFTLVSENDIVINKRRDGSSLLHSIRRVSGEMSKRFSKQE